MARSKNGIYCGLTFIEAKIKSRRNKADIAAIISDAEGDDKIIVAYNQHLYRAYYRDGFYYIDDINDRIRNYTMPDGKVVVDWDNYGGLK